MPTKTTRTNASTPASTAAGTPSSNPHVALAAARRGAQRSKPARESNLKPRRSASYVSARRCDGRLFYVRRFPQALIDAGLITASGPSVRKALGTMDWSKAEAKARLLAVEHDLEWAALRKQLTPAAAPREGADGPRQLQGDDIPVLSARLEALLLHTDDIDRAQLASPMSDDEFDAYESDLNSQRSALRRSSQRADTSTVTEEAIGFLQAEGVECHESSAQWPQWLAAVLQTHLKALGQISARLDGESVTTPKLPTLLGGKDDLDDLDCALEYWTAKASPGAKTLIETRTVMERFKEATGRCRISAVQPEDVIAFVRMEGTRESSRGGVINPQTANKALALLKSVFALAHADYLVLYKIANPLASLKRFKVKAKDIRRRKQFTTEQLQKYFTGAVFASGYRPLGGAGEAAYWMPVLGEATGARMTELLQLEVKDVIIDGDVVMLQTETIDDDDEEDAEEDALSDENFEPQSTTKPTNLQKNSTSPEMVVRSVKTRESYRRIPLHRAVLDLGFLKYVEWMRASGHTRLFPHVLSGANSSLSANFSKFFNRQLTQAGIKSRMLDWISFRHGMKTQARNIDGLNFDVVDYIMGHAQHRASQGYGSFPTNVLDRTINAFSFPALEGITQWTPPVQEPRKVKQRNKKSSV